MNEVPVPRLVPPVEAAYQLIIPAEAVAPRVAVPVPQMLTGVVPVIVGTAITVRVYIAVAAAHGAPDGLSVVTVMITVFPTSASDGVYVKLKVDEVDEAGLTVPEPSEVMVTFVAFEKVFPLILTAVVPQVLPMILVRFTAGAFEHPHDTEKLVPGVTQPAASLTVMIWFPLPIPEKMTTD